MPLIVKVRPSPQMNKNNLFIFKHAQHWHERQRAQGKTVAEVAKLQNRTPNTIRLHPRHLELYQFESIKEGHSSGRPNILSDEHKQ